MTDLLAGDLTHRSLLIDGAWTSGAGERFDVLDPATEEVLATLSSASDTDAVAAVQAADDAAAGWAATAPRVRSEILLKVFTLMTERAGALADLVVAENGKGVSDARAEIAYAAEFFRWFAEEAVRIEGRYGVAPAGGARTLVQHRPVGVALLVAPWNFPAAMLTRKVAPALAAGCPVVLKPASETPLTALALGEIFVEAGVPAGVVSILPAAEAGPLVETLLDQRPVRKLSFTGSTRVGSILLAQAAPRVLNCSMELGGNAPFVVTATADVTAAVDGAMVAKFRNGGQACTAANRFFVHARVHDQFVTEFGARVEALRVGPGHTDPVVGPMISARARDTLAGVVETAVDEGAVVAASALVDATSGHFFSPTLLTGVAPDAEILGHELFGPVAPVVAYTDDDDLVAMVNSTEVGLSSYVYAQDLEHAMRLAEAFDVGMVGINRGIVSDPSAPFGGTRGSGLGREGSHEGIDAFLETQYVSLGWA